MKEPNPLLFNHGMYKELTLVQTRKRLYAWDKFLMMLGSGIVAIVGLFIPDPLFRCINVFLIIMICWEYISKYTIADFEEEVTLPVMGNSKR
jgi:hypothetical protein